MPAYSTLNQRTAGEGSAAWEILFRAWEDRAKGRDVVIMSVGDPDFATPEPVIDAAGAAMGGGYTHYVQIPGMQDLRQAVAEELMRVSGADDYQLTGDNVMIMPGTQNALFGASLILLETGDEVIALDPMYITYQATFEAGGASLVRVPCPRETGFRPDIAAIEAAVTPKTKAIVFANPNNPTGVVMHRDELGAIADIAVRHDLWVIADEVYATQTFDLPHLSIAALPAMKERTVTCGSLSKSHAMTGWRIGWIAGPEDFIGHAANLGLAMHYGVAAFVQRAAITALTDADADRDAMLAAYRRRCGLVVEALKGANNIEVLEPEGAMYVLVDVSATGLTSGEFSRRLYEAEGVSVLDATPFGEPAAGCIRIAFTISDEELAEGCKRIRHFLQSL